jgi:phytoene desaturase
MLYLGVDGEVDLPHHTIYVSEQYKQNLEDIVTNGTLSKDPSVYICNPSPLDPTLAPRGKSSLYVLMPTPNCNSGVDWHASYPALREATLDQMERRFGLRGIRSRIVAEVPFGPTHWAESNIQFGATFNLAHNLGQMLHKRPQNRLAGFDNVYLVGGGTHPGSGLPTIFLSAQITSRLLCERVGKGFAGTNADVNAIAHSRQMRPALV